MIIDSFLKHKTNCYQGGDRSSQSGNAALFQWPGKAERQFDDNL